MNKLEYIEKLHKQIETSIFCINPPLDYNGIQKALIELCSAIKEIDTDENDSLWYIGEFSHCTLDSLLVGAYWHYTEWHNGQYSKSYAALCALGSIFQPGMTSGPEPDSVEADVYNMLDILAQTLFKGVS